MKLMVKTEELKTSSPMNDTAMQSLKLSTEMYSS